VTLDQDELMSDGLATVAQAAAFLSLSRSWVYGAMDAGRIPFCKFGEGRSARRIPWRALRAFAAGSLTGGWNEQQNSVFGGPTQVPLVNEVALNESHSVATRGRLNGATSNGRNPSVGAGE